MLILESNQNSAKGKGPSRSASPDRRSSRQQPAVRSPYAQASPRQSTSGRPKSGSNRGTRASAEAEFVFTKRGNSVQGPRDSPNQMSASARISSAELASGLPDDLPNEDIMPQALEILASLASLGISENVRGKVQAALSELHQQTAAGRPGSMLAPRPETSPAGPASLPPAGSPQHKRLEQLEAKLEMARSIMKKLYYKNVNLEKELKLLQASATQLAALDSSSMPGSPGPPSPNGPGPSGLQLGFPPSPSARAGAAGSQLGTAFRPESAPVFSPTSQAAAGSTTSSPVIQSLYDKDSTIAELQAALDASRRRAAMLETQLSTTTKSVDNASVREAMAQSALLSQKYRQIRQEYHQLLSNRAMSVQSAATAPLQAKQVLKELHTRLHREVEDREAEAALYSAKLYDAERQLSDWYVERRMLEDHIAKLNEEIQARDKLDTEIQSAVVGLFEKQKELQEAVHALADRLREAGVEPAGVVRNKALLAPATRQS